MRWQQWTRWGTKNRAALLPFFPLCSTILKPHLESYYILSNRRIEINWIINRKLQVSKLKNFIHFIRNSNIEYNYSRESSKIIENPIRTDIKTSPLHSYETCSFLERIESRNRFFHGRPKANSAQDVKMSLGVTTISSTPRRVAISRRYELLILAT